jgi:hypothetical protein
LSIPNQFTQQLRIRELYAEDIKWWQRCCIYKKIHFVWEI